MSIDFDTRMWHMTANLTASITLLLDYFTYIFLWDMMFSWQWRFRLWFSELWHYIALWVLTGILQKPVASTCKLEL